MFSWVESLVVSMDSVAEVVVGIVGLLAVAAICIIVLMVVIKFFSTDLTKPSDFWRTLKEADENGCYWVKQGEGTAVYEVGPTGQFTGRCFFEGLQDMPAPFTLAEAVESKLVALPSPATAPTSSGAAPNSGLALTA